MSKAADTRGKHLKKEEGEPGLANTVIWDVYRWEEAWPNATARLISWWVKLPLTGRNPERDQAQVGGASRGWAAGRPERRTSCPPPCSSIRSSSTCRQICGLQRC